jgi:hypothetical protein
MKAKALLSQGLISKANETLSHEPPLPITDALIDQLHELHPDAIDKDQFITLPKPEQLSITLKCQQVRDAFASINRGTNPGLSGFRGEYFKSMAGRNDDINTQSFLTAITSFMELCVNGALPAQWYAAIR